MCVLVLCIGLTPFKNEAHERRWVVQEPLRLEQRLDTDLQGEIRKSVSSIHRMRDGKAGEPSAKVDPGDVVAEERQRSKRRAAGEEAVHIVEMRVHHRA